MCLVNPRAELEAQREITQVAGDLYRFQNNFHVLVFVVTPEGVIATDPIDANAAAWLRGQIQERFKQPIRYVIYSHDHADHIAGGAVLKEAGATVIAQLNGQDTNGCRPQRASWAMSEAIAASWTSAAADGSAGMDRQPTGVSRSKGWKRALYAMVGLPAIQYPR